MKTGHSLALVVLAGMLAQCATVRPKHRATRAVAPPLPEDRLGVAGAPTDLLDFDFEPETAGDEPPALELDGLILPSAETMTRLEPYLESRRARLQGATTDGASLVIVTRVEGVAQAYELRPPDSALQPITSADGPVIQVSRSSAAGGAWFYRSDVQGTEDYQVSRLDKDGVSLVTDGVSRHGPFAMSRQGVLALTGNARNGRDMDVYLYAAGGNRASALEIALLREGSWSVAGWSPAGKDLLIRQFESYTNSSFWVFSPPDARPQPLDPSPAPSISTRGRFTRPDTVHLTSDRSGEFLHLFEVSWPGRDFVDLTPDLQSDVDDFATFDGGRLIAYSTNERGVSKLWLLDRDNGVTALPLPDGAIVGDLRVTNNGSSIAFTMDRATDTGDVWSLDLQSQNLTRLTQSQSPTLDYSRFVAPSLVMIESFDGLEVPAWVYRPREATGPLPVLLWIHGGPEEQHEPAFHPLIQYLVTELGVAVVAPNIRGSSGYGRTYVGLDDGLLREDAIRDVGAVIDWIGAQPPLDPSRVAIFGGSYGGYVVLASLARYGDRLAAGIDQVGVSNFVTFLENTSDYRVDQRRVEYGDERDPDVRQFLLDISPTSQAGLIRSPLFVVHGANDPRVPVAEARQIVEAVRSHGADAIMMTALDEGHGFRKRANRDAFYGALVEFLTEELELVTAVEKL